MQLFFKVMAERRARPATVVIGTSAAISNEAVSVSEPTDIFISGNRKREIFDLIFEITFVNHCLSVMNEAHSRSIDRFGVRNRR